MGMNVRVPFQAEDGMKGLYWSETFVRWDVLFVADPHPPPNISMPSLMSYDFSSRVDDMSVAPFWTVVAIMAAIGGILYVAFKRMKILE